MAQPILPFALPLLLCDGHAPAGHGKVNFFGAFHAIRPTSYPHTQNRLCVVAHLTGGLGVLTTYVDVRSADTDELVFTTLPRQMTIPDRNVLVRLVNNLESVVFPGPGIYFVQLWCENTPIADFRLQLHEPGANSVGGANGQPE